MNREEAINVIKGARKYLTVGTPIWNVKKVDEAFDMAIEALTEPINCVKCEHYYETEDDTDVHGHCRMDTAHTNLISRADALRELNGACSNWKDDCKVAEIINALPSSDAVPQLRQTDTLIIADALRYLAKDTERHLVDRTRADALRQQFLKYGASMCKGGAE